MPTSSENSMNQEREPSLQPANSPQAQRGGGTTLTALFIAGLSAVLGAGLGTFISYAEIGLPGSDEARGKVTAVKGKALVKAGMEPRLVVYPGEGQDKEHPENFDFGVMELGASAEKKFLIGNEGKSVLTLKKGKESCSCTIADLNKQELLPGEKTEIVLGWKTDEKPLGPLRLSVPLYTNDPENDLRLFQVSGKIVSTLQMTPPQFSFSQIREGETKTVETKLISYRDEPLGIENYKLEDDRVKDHFKLEWEELPASELGDKEAKRGLRLRLTASDKLPFGPFEEAIEIVTKYKDVPPVRLEALGRVIGDLRINGSKFNADRQEFDLGSFPAKDGVVIKGFIMISGEHASATQVELKEANPEFVQMNIGDVKDDGQGDHATRRITFELAIPPGSPARSFIGGPNSEPGRIVLKTTHPKYPEVPLKVRFFPIN